jgi:hypothetical protein
MEQSVCFVPDASTNGACLNLVGCMVRMSLSPHPNVTLAGHGWRCLEIQALAHWSSRFPFAQSSALSCTVSCAFCLFCMIHDTHLRLLTRLSSHLQDSQPQPSEPGAATIFAQSITFTKGSLFELLKLLRSIGDNGFHIILQAAAKTHGQD